MHGHAIISRHGRDVIHEPVEVISVILDATAETVGLGCEDTTLLIDGKRGGRVEARGGVF